MSSCRATNAKGQAFGKLRVDRRVGSQPTGVTWLCFCACGRPVTRVSTELQRGSRCSCGVCGIAENAPRAFRTDVVLSDAQVHRFFDAVDVAADDAGCWLWSGPRFPNGYGRFRCGGGDEIAAHRAAWIIAFGPIPQGMVLLHLCDTPLCVCADHLAIGSPRANVYDAVRKGNQDKRGAA